MILAVGLLAIHIIQCIQVVCFLSIILISLLSLTKNVAAQYCSRTVETKHNYRHLSYILKGFDYSGSVSSMLLLNLVKQLTTLGPLCGYLSDQWYLLPKKKDTYVHCITACIKKFSQSQDIELSCSDQMCAVQAGCRTASLSAKHFIWQYYNHVRHIAISTTHLTHKVQQPEDLLQRVVSMVSYLNLRYMFISGCLCYVMLHKSHVITGLV